MQEKIS